MPQGGVHWQGTQRRACAPGAHWNVQVVRGKVTTRCLWHACKALGIGLLLMLLGACMATIGYYADQLSMAQEIRGNLTVRVKNESRGFHLNNLSYAGPIVMGVGGFIVVAACVMTFEARDSAAKVVPARFRFNQNTPCKSNKQRSRRSTSCQTTRWDHQLGLFRVHRSPSPSTHEVSRKRLTAELMQFSKNLEEKNNPQPIKKSPSAPNLAVKNSPRKKPSRYTGCALLNAELLKRHAMSVDNAAYNPQVSRESLEYNKISESQVSMAMDLHMPNKGGPVTLKIKDRSDTAQRHQLLRQTRIDDDDLQMELRKGAAGGHAGKYQSFAKYPDDFVSRKRNSVDLRVLEELEFRRSPKDFRKISSPNFRKMSLDRVGGEARKNDRTPVGYRKASLDCRKSPDIRKKDYRKCSMDKCAADHLSSGTLEMEFRPRSDTGELPFRRHRHGRQLYHSRSDDNRRRSFDKHRSDSQCSRFSLNTQNQPTPDGLATYELKYFATNASLDTDGSRGDVSDDSHTVDIEGNGLPADGPTETDALLEEPELENLTEVEVETSGDDIDAPDEVDDTLDYKVDEQGDGNA
ncbi:uncharacterized protein LOC124182044 isoform X1 [Neodiprion fabricii]|uniref:uncharacterized protein LOC124182044 isoform X1 n=2 Tax=Neodiprion fabricii TaxID=2872261 RepID=UPI001ED97FA9|nr:uncharacterized protein LOC124182044 isoform X1 [Neodiprion fabricii]